jgi:hypothetical protein
MRTSFFPLTLLVAVATPLNAPTLNFTWTGGMRRRILTTAIITAGLAGCVYHLDSAIPDELVRFDPALVGTWDSGGSAQVVITAGENSFYLLKYREGDGSTSSYYGRLGRLDEHNVLEIRPAFDAWPMGRFLIIIDELADEITTWKFVADSVTAAVKRDGAEYSQLSLSSSDLILTAPTPALVTTIIEYLRRPGYVADEEVWRRVK